MKLGPAARSRRLSGWRRARRIGGGSVGLRRRPSGRVAGRPAAALRARAGLRAREPAFGEVFLAAMVASWGSGTAPIMPRTRAGDNRP